jgi:hypothetical protein
MKSTPIFAAALLGASLTLACGTASAAGHTSASSNLSPLAFQLTDLTPADGQNAGMQYDLMSSYLNSRLDEPGPPATSPTMTQAYTGTLAAATTLLDNAYAHSAGSQNGQLGDQHGESTLQEGSPLAAGAFAAGNNTAVLTLLPHTALTITGHATGAVSVADMLDPASYLAHAGAMVGLQDIDHNWIGYFNQSTDTDGFTFTGGFDTPLEMYYANQSDSSVTLYLYAGVNNATSRISAVPEPAGYAMLGAGLLLAAVLRRPRRQG